jgi:alpha-1,2-mannosyltransferase
VATVLAICLPFFLHSPTLMWRYVVADQLGRPRSTAGALKRLTEMTGLQVVLPQASALTMHLTLTVVLASVAAAAVAVWRTAGARVIVVLLISQGAVLLASPTYYLHYNALTAAPGALVLAVGAGRGYQWLAPRTPQTLTWVALVTVLALILVYATPGVLRPKGKHLSARLAVAGARTPGCITADDPAYLIEMNVLSRDLDAGCRVWIDLTGITYDQAGGGGPGRVDNRATNPTWHHLVMGYLLSGEATMVARKATRLDPASLARVRRLPVIASSGGFTLRRVR